MIGHGSDHIGTHQRVRPHGCGTRWAIAVLVAIGSVGTSGCSGLTGLQNTVHYNRTWDDFVAGYRNSAWSAKAWHRRKQQFACEKYLVDFSKGFRAGYESVADGGNGCTPAFPPSEYLSWRYQSAEGQAKVSAWFAGFPHGARAAEEDGVGNWTQIQTSNSIQQEYAQNHLMQKDHVGMYPIPANTNNCLPCGNGSYGVPQGAVEGMPQGEVIIEDHRLMDGNGLVDPAVIIPN